MQRGRRWRRISQSLGEVFFFLLFGGCFRFEKLVQGQLLPAISIARSIVRRWSVEEIHCRDESFTGRQRRRQSDVPGVDAFVLAIVQFDQRDQKTSWQVEIGRFRGDAFGWEVGRVSGRNGRRPGEKIRHGLNVGWLLLNGGNLVLDLQFLLLQRGDLMIGVVDESLVLTAVALVGVLDGSDGCGNGTSIPDQEAFVVLVPHLLRSLQPLQCSALKEIALCLPQGEQFVQFGTLFVIRGGQDGTGVHLNHDGRQAPEKLIGPFAYAVM